MPESAFRPGSDDEWEVLLRRLRQQSAAHPQPFFYQRVRARLQAEANAPLFLLPRWLRRPAYAVLLALLILAVSGDSMAAAHTARLASHPAPRSSRW